MLHLPAGRLHPADDPAQPAGPVLRPGQQVRDLGDVLVVLGGCRPGRSRASTRRRGACRWRPRRPAVIIHPQVNSTFRRGDARDSRCSDEVVAGAGPVDADHDLPPEPGRDLPQRRGQHLFMIGERVRPGVAGAEQHGQALAGIPAPGPQWVETVAFLPGGSCPFLVRVGGDQGRVHVDDDPARSGPCPR